MSELQTLLVFRDGARIGTGDRFSTYKMRTADFEVCLFWTAAPFRPREVIDLGLEDGTQLRVKIVMRPPSGEQEIRASGIVLGEPTGANWRDVLRRVDQDTHLEKLFLAEEKRWTGK